MRSSNSIRRLSLRHKLIITSIACLMLPAVIMLYITSVYSKWIIREHALANATQSLAIVQSQINSVLEEMVSISNFIQFDAEIKTLLEEAKTDPVATKQLTTRLEQVAGEKRDLQLTLLTKDGRAYSDYSFYDFDPKQFFRREWFTEMSQLSAYDTLFLGAEHNYLPAQTPDQRYIYISARALMEKASKPYAYLIVSRTEDTIRNFFGDFTEDVYLLDPNNRIISNRDAELIGSGFDTVLKTEDLGTSGIIRLNGENQLYISLPLRYAGWRLVSLAPYEQLTKQVTGIYRTELLLQFLLATSFLFALAYLLERFTRPVRTLGEVAKQVESGDLTVRSNIRGGDEVGILGRSFDHMLDRIQHMLEQVKLEQELKRQAELAMLQAQIHPHFLFNVLSSIRLKLMMKGDEENAVLLGSLSSLLRATISNKNEFVTIHAEIETAKQYMELMNFTVRHPVELNMIARSDLLLETVPRFILQPIIENAYKHGFTRRGGEIAIRFDKTDSCLTMEISDDGAGMESEQLKCLQERLKLRKWEILEQSSHKDAPIPPSGIGLSNVYERMKLIYGDRFEMKIWSAPQLGMTIELLIPLSANGG
jgi:two-component system, sensor histidine kinase YesM